MFADPVFITPGRYTYDLLNEYWPENPSGMRDTWHFSLTFWYFNWILSYQLSYTNLLRRVRNSTQRVSSFTANYHHSPKSWQSAVFNLPVIANEQRVRSLNPFFFGKQVACSLTENDISRYDLMVMIMMMMRMMMMMMMVMMMMMITGTLVMCL